MSEDWKSRLDKTRIAVDLSKAYLWKTCIKSLEKGDVWKIELNEYHIMLNVSVKKLKNSKYLGFLKFKVKGLERWQDFVQLGDSTTEDDAKQQVTLQFLSYLKSDDVQKIYGHPPLIEPKLPTITGNDNYQIEYELDGKLVGPPTDLELFPKLNIVKLSGFNAQTFRVVVSGKTNTKDEAVAESKKIVNDFLDYYCVRTQQTITILNHSKPHSITFNGKSELDLGFSLEYFIPDERITSKISDELEKIKQNSNSNYIQNAMKYYRKARDADELEDKLVDYFIALEALYSRNETEITFRFSIRMSVLLEVDSNEIKQTFDDAKDYYHKRSGAVHGDLIKIDESKINKIDLWVRKSILYFIELSKNYSTHESTIAEIDYAIVDLDTRTNIHKITDPANSLLKEDHRRYQYEFE